MSVRRAAAALAALLAMPAAAGVPGAMGGHEESPVRAETLAPGEVLLETGAFAQVTVPADRATFTIPLISEGTDDAAARRAHRALVARVIEAARRAGVPADGIVAFSGTGDLTLYTHRIMRPPAEAEGSAGAIASSMIILHLGDIRRVEDVGRAVREAGAEMITQYRPEYSLIETGPARREAKARALAMARADAEAYAAALDMRVVRVARISERLGLDMYTLGMGYTGLYRRRVSTLLGEETGPEIEIGAVVGVDFVLAPR